jgi:4'-phosphopantetheinyl transferase
MRDAGVTVRCVDPRAPRAVDASRAVALLTPPERARYSGLPEAQRTSFLVGRALLRATVSELVDVDADAVVLDSRCDSCGLEHGRPRVIAPAAAVRADVRVSLSRCDAAVAVAATRGVPVGIDVEVLDARRFKGVAEVVLDAAELARLQRRGEARAGAVARAWTRKEAVLKATGDGLRVDPRDIEITREFGDRPRVRGVRHRVRLRDLHLGDGLVAAVALLG